MSMGTRKILRQRLGVDAECKAKDKEIDAMSEREITEHLEKWNGSYYTNMFK